MQRSPSQDSSIGAETHVSEGTEQDLRAWEEHDEQPSGDRGVYFGTLDEPHAPNAPNVSNVLMNLMF